MEAAWSSYHASGKTAGDARTPDIVKAVFVRHRLSQRPRAGRGRVLARAAAHLAILSWLLLRNLRHGDMAVINRGHSLSCNTRPPLSRSDVVGYCAYSMRGCQDMARSALTSDVR